MSRFVFTTFGSLGDLHPSIAIAQALIRRGHQAVVAASEDYRIFVEASGVLFAPVRPNLTEMGEYEALVKKVFDLYRGPEYLIRRLVMPHLRASFDDLLQASEGADLLVSHPLTVTLPLVAQRRGLPWVATVLSPLSFMSVYDPPLVAAMPWLHRFGPGLHRLMFGLFRFIVGSWEGPLRKLRKELGMPPSKLVAIMEGQFSPLRNLALFDPQLATPQPDWPAHVQVCGAPVYDGEAEDPNAVAELESFLAAGDAPIVFALGSSAIWMGENFWPNAAAAAQRLGRRAILLTGPNLPDNLPEGVTAFAYLPYSKVFPRAAVVVHHAGIGTLAQAMRAGRPQLIVPVAFDQPDNAHRAAALGIARTIPFRKVTADRLVEELEPLLTQMDYLEKARAIAGDLATVDGAQHAADALIECLAQSKGAR